MENLRNQGMPAFFVVEENEDASFKFTQTSFFPLKELPSFYKLAANLL